MFDIGATELLLIAVVAILVIGPKDMPLALRTAGRWIGKVRRVSAHFKSGVEAMIREAEMEEMDKKWKAQNEAIMAAHPGADAADDGPQMELLKPGPESGQKQIESAAASGLSRSDTITDKPASNSAPDTPPPPP